MDRAGEPQGPFSLKARAYVVAHLYGLNKVYGLICHKSGCQHPGECEKLAGKYGDQEIPTCPIAWLNQDASFLAALDLYTCSQVSPLEGWPDSYSPWVVETVLELHQQSESAQAARIEEVTGGKS